MPFETQSKYRIECECGEKIESHEKEVRCPKCGRHLVIEWPAKYER